MKRGANAPRFPTRLVPTDFCCIRAFSVNFVGFWKQRKRDWKETWNPRVFFCLQLKYNAQLWLHRTQKPVTTKADKTWTNSVHSVDDAFGLPEGMLKISCRECSYKTIENKTFLLHERTFFHHNPRQKHLHGASIWKKWFLLCRVHRHGLRFRVFMFSLFRTTVCT